MGISIRAYARHRGVTDGAVRKAIKSGRITTEADGTINPKKADQQWGANTDAVMQRGEKKPEKPNGNQNKKKPTEEDDESFMEARRKNEVIRAEMAELQLLQLKGELIEKESVVKHVFQLGRQERDAWLNWPARIAAQMASEMGVDEHKMHTALERFVREQLEELGDFTTKLGE